MILPVFFTIIFVIFAWKSIYETDNNFLDYCFSTLFFILFTAIVFGVGVGTASLIGLAAPKDWTEPEIAKLVSLRSSDGISGQFFLGSGNIGTNMHYFFYREVEQGYQPGKVVVANNVTVFEEERQDGELRTYTYQFINPLFRSIAINWESYKYEFFIPRGSIKKNFSP